MNGDRECPHCGEMSLFEQGLNQWLCVICGREFDDEWLEGEE